MNKLMSFFIIACIVFFTDCKRKTETVFLTPNISVELPVNYKKDIRTSKSSEISNPELIIQLNSYNYSATINNDDIFIGNLINNEFDTLSIQEKKEKIIPNLKGYVRGINGNKLIHKDTIINELALNDFSFEVEQKDTLFIIYGRLIIQDTNLLIFNYKSKIPITNRSLKDKDRFFESIKIK